MGAQSNGSVSIFIIDVSIRPLTKYVKLRLYMRRECRERFPRHRLQRKPLVGDPDMHHGTCVTHVPWCMSGLLTRGGGENDSGISGACTDPRFDVSGKRSVTPKSDIPHKLNILHQYYAHWCPWFECCQCISIECVQIMRHCVSLGGISITYASSVSRNYRNYRKLYQTPLYVSSNKFSTLIINQCYS